MAGTAAMTSEIREFNQNGLEELAEFLRLAKAAPNTMPPWDLLDDHRYFKVVPKAGTVEKRAFKSKLEFARYIFERTSAMSPATLRLSIGVWAWITLFYFDELCPADSRGNRRLRSSEKYLASGTHIASGLDKHLLFFPWKMYALHKEDAGWILGGALGDDTKVMRELANSYRRNVSPTFVKLAKAMYFDDTSNTLKRGATTNRPGSLRRLDRVMSQLDLTYDIFGSTPDVLKRLLPQREFAKWIG